MSEKRSGWITFNWARLCDAPVSLGNDWYGRVVHSPDDGGYYGEASVMGGEGNTTLLGSVVTKVFPTAQEAGDALAAKVRATF